MINLFQDMMPNFSPKNVGLEVSRPTIFMINRTQLNPKNHWFLRLQISTVCQKNIVRTSLFLVGGWISYQIFKKGGGEGLTWSQFLDGVAGKDGGEIFQEDGGGAWYSFYVKINWNLKYLRRKKVYSWKGFPLPI